MQRFADYLNSENVKITFCNLSNVAEWDAHDKLPETLILLPFSNKCIMLYSKSLCDSAPKLLCQELCYSREEYIRESKERRPIKPAQTYFGYPTTFFTSPLESKGWHHLLEPNYIDREDILMQERARKRKVGCCSIV